MTPLILIVEDDPAILRGLEMNLQLDGYRVQAVRDGEAALEAVRAGGVDLMVLDLMVPRSNGFQVVRTLRLEGHDLPVVILSARTAEADIVMGLELGADDYVTKPFRVAELLARLKAHLRRKTPQGRVVFGEVEVDLDRQLVKRAGQPVELTRKEFDLLALLLKRAGRAVTRETILAQVWGTQYIGTDRTVDNIITRLRQKLDRAGEPRYFLTARGVGYRLVLDDDELQTRGSS